MILLIIAILVLAAIATRPNALEHQNEVAARAVELVPGQSFLHDVVAQAAAKRAIVVDDWLLFTVGKLRLANGTTITVSWGAFGNVHVLVDNLKNAIK